jgi:hypothetical protein
MCNIVRKIKILVLILAVMGPTFFSAINVPVAYADYYRAYTGSGTIGFRMYLRGTGDSVIAYYNSGPYNNPVYVPGNMGAGLIKVKLHINSSSNSSYWNHYTTASIPLYAIDSNGNQTLCKTLTFNPTSSSGTDIDFGEIYLGQNYRGFKIGDPSASNNGYWNTGSATVSAYIAFEFNAIIFASTESQFNTLFNNASAAATNAVNAYNAANSAKTSADSAKASADTAASRVWDPTESKSAAQLAKEARDKANEALTAVNNMQTIITDIKNTVITDNIPPSVEVKTLSGATATSGSFIRLVIAASDNKSTSLSYNVNGGAYSPLPADGKVSVPLSSPGPNTIVISVKDEAGNVATKAITIWKL